MKILTQIVMCVAYTALAAAAMMAFMYGAAVPAIAGPWSWFDAITIIFVSEVVGVAAAAAVFLIFHAEVVS